jgi:hypothetical protein
MFPIVILGPAQDLAHGPGVAVRLLLEEERRKFVERHERVSASIPEQSIEGHDRDVVVALRDLAGGSGLSHGEGGDQREEGQ